ncbi:MAG: glycosyltransferase [Melioribacteraceae bacterium]|nr:glycosyltransferase [Melioribacteraceae bacterium]
MGKEYELMAIRDYYPDNNNPTNSIWVYDQVIGLQGHSLNSIVISPTPILPFFFRRLKKFRLFPKPDKIVKNYKNTEVIRPPYIKIPGKIFSAFVNNNLSNTILIYGKNFKPKLIHAHFGRNGVASIKLKRKLQIPLVTYFYGDDVGVKKHKVYLQNLYQELINVGDLFIALSEDMKKDLINIGFPADKVKVVHLGVDLELFKVNKNTNREKIIFTSVGRFHEYKGGQDTISAFSQVHSKYHATELRIVGDGPYVDKLKEQVRFLNLNKSVKFINNFLAKDPRQVVNDEISNCDIFMLTTFQNEEGVKTGTPVVLMEAQACGKPCISTRYAGIPEVVINNKTGFIVEQRNIDKIVASMISLIENVGLRSEFGANARNHIINEFNSQIQIEKLAKLYKNLINNNA